MSFHLQISSKQHLVFDRVTRTSLEFSPCLQLPRETAVHRVWCEEASCPPSQPSPPPPGLPGTASVIAWGPLTRDFGPEPASSSKLSVTGREATVTHISLERRIFAVV